MTAASSQARTTLALALCALAGALAPPLAAAQQTGGTGAAGTPATGGTAAGGGGPLTLTFRAAAMHGRVIHFRGLADPSFIGRRMRIERYDARAGWRVVARARIRASSRYLARWRADRIGHFWVRAVITGRRRGAQASSAWPMAQVKVYRPVIATWYGPGFYGRRTACGQRLTPAMVGLAHPKLRCGTLVDVIYRGRAATLPVVDRGPYANGASFDLTAAAAAALGIRGTVRIGAVAVRARNAAPPR
jgi:rare lipoprotein A